MGRRTGSQEDGDGKPYEGHGSLTEYVLVNAHRAGISDAGARRSEASENITRIAYRTARLSRVAHKSFPKSEAALFNAVKPKKRQSIADQYANAKLITQVMSRGNH
jgi:hypothetical protein